MLLQRHRNEPVRQPVTRHIIPILVVTVFIIWFALIILILIVQQAIPDAIVITAGGKSVQNVNLLVTANFFFIFGILLVMMFALAAFFYKLRQMRAKIMFRDIGGHGVENDPLPSWYDTAVKRIFPREHNLRTGNALLFDPVSGIVRQGSGDLLLAVTNTSSADIVIEGITIAPGESMQIRLKLDTKVPGVECHIEKIEYTQGKKKYIEPVIVEYTVFSKDEIFGVSFSKYIYRHGTLVPVLQVKNFTAQEVTLDSGIVIPPEFEGEIELLTSVSEAETRSSKTLISYLFGGKKHEIQVPLPIPHAFQMLAKGMIHQLISYLTEHDSPSDAEFKYQKGVIFEQLGEVDKAEAEYKTALELDPYHARSLHALRHLEKGLQVHGSYTSHIRDKESDAYDPEEDLLILFPSELLPRYRPLRVLASDEFARIFLCIREENGEERTLKVFKSGAVEQGTFYLKVATWRPLHHPNILTLYGAEYSPVTFLEMEYAPGILYRGNNVSSLADLSFPIKADAARRICIGILEGLIYLHSQGGRHFDLQPRFVLIGSKLIPKISGFVIFAQERRELVRSFSCPERIDPDGFGKPGTKCDIYSAGAILYTMLTGALWDYDNSSKLPSAYAASLTPYDTVVSRLLAPEKENRCTAEEAIALLQQI